MSKYKKELRIRPMYNKKAPTKSRGFFVAPNYLNSNSLNIDIRTILEIS